MLTVPKKDEQKKCQLWAKSTTGSRGKVIPTIQESILDSSDAGRCWRQMVTLVIMAKASVHTVQEKTVVFYQESHMDRQNTIFENIMADDGLLS